MGKLIIDNRTDMSMGEVLEYIREVIHLGRISNDGKQYSYLTSFGCNVVVVSGLNKKSDRLIILQEKEE